MLHRKSEHIVQCYFRSTTALHSISYLLTFGGCIATLLTAKRTPECKKHDNQQIKFAIVLITVKYHKTTLPYSENGLLVKAKLIYWMWSVYARWSACHNVCYGCLVRNIICSRVNLMPDNRQLNRLVIFYVFKLDGCYLCRTYNNRIINIIAAR